MDGTKTCPVCGRRYDAAATFCQKDGSPLEIRAPSPVPVAADPFERTPYREPEPQDDPLIGQVILDQFRVEERIGEGGMGTVYRAHQTNIDRDVAIKVLRPELLANTEAVRRFKREAKVATSLDHPNVVRVYLFGQLPDSRLYLVMEYLRGRPMTELLEAGALPLSRALHLAIQTAQGIGSAHAMGVVHRDVKPENVLVLKRGDDPDFVKVLDFGIARLLWDQHTQATQAGTIFGTARYISPEGAAGEPTDMRSDVYSLGVLTYQLLTGQTPFDGESPVALLMKHIHQPARDLRETPSGRYVPEPVANVVMRALAKNPDARVDDARRFAAALLEAEARSHMTPGMGRVDETPIIAHGTFTPVTLPGIAGLGRKRRWPTFAGAFLLGAAAVTGGAFLVTRLSATDAPAQVESDLNARAQRALAAGRYDAPSGDNVKELTARVLAQTPGDPTATRIRREASAELAARAQRALDARRLFDARADLDRALALAPEEPALAQLASALEPLEREAALRPGLRVTPAEPVASRPVTLEAVLPQSVMSSDAGLSGYFEARHGHLRPIRVGAERRSARRFVGTYTFRHVGHYMVTFVPSVGERGPTAGVDVRRNSRRPSGDGPTTIQQPAQMNPTVTMEPRPPVDDRIDWSAPPPPVNGAPPRMTPAHSPTHRSPSMSPAHRPHDMSPSMSPAHRPHSMSPSMSPLVPPPDDTPPPPWTG
ncbi:MAG: protein kinase [Deltaproteobacteria bacterium]|nr:protein kinase [Deltaproteobacteria bacterium]